MAFTGKATYAAGATLPEIAEDVSDLVGINSPFETPLLDALGDAARPARSTVHEWLEDALLPNSDTIAAVGGSPTTDTTFTAAHGSRFRVGDQIQMAGSLEVMLVTAINTSTNVLTVARGYGGSGNDVLTVAAGLLIIGNAALEGDDAPATRFTTRTRASNYTQIFSAAVEISGSELAVRQIGVANELDYQKQNRLRELMRDLENSVINGRAAATNPQGSSTARRTMRGILPSIVTNRMHPGDGNLPTASTFTEEILNAALRHIWSQSNGTVDLIVVGGKEKRALNQFVAPSVRRYAPSDDTYRDGVSVYESDFGVCRVVLSRWVPAGMALLLDSSRVEVLPLAGRNFHYKPLATTGDKESGQVIGEYTMEFRNEAAHGVITDIPE
ncbi:MAG TPA: DUF5309 family protein [Tepidisphaeraceae bacterium]|nr:DUF5309 family protein [Tepidisphaeraceae bacterium]